MPGMEEPSKQRKYDPSPFLIAVPLVVTNSVAIGVQALWAHEEAERQWPALAGTTATIVLAVGWALALESIAVYLSGMAHAKRLANQSSGLLQGAAYLVALGIAALNYSHLAPTLKPTNAALGAAFLSAVSPWLWSVYSQYRSRERLLELGLVDPRAPKFSTANKVLHPYRTASAVRQAVWDGETSPDRARRAWEARRTGELVRAEAIEASLAPERDRRPIVRPVVIRQHRTTVRRQTIQITDLPRREAIEASPRIEVEAFPVSPAPGRDATRLAVIHEVAQRLGRIPGRDPVKAALKERGLGAGSNKVDELLAIYRERMAGQ